MFLRFGKGPDFPPSRCFSLAVVDESLRPFLSPISFSWGSFPALSRFLFVMDWSLVLFEVRHSLMRSWDPLTW